MKRLSNQKALSIPRWVPVMLLFVTALVVSIRGDGIPARSGDRLPAATQVKRWFPEVGSVAFDAACQGFIVRDRREEILGMIVDTVDLSPSYIGYGGEIPLCIALDPNDRILGIQLGPNHETRSYLASLKERGFVDQWQGLTAREAVAQEVTTVSGATLSSRAIARTLRHSLANVYNYELPADMQRMASDTPFSPKAIALYAVLAIGLLSFVRPSIFGRYRRLLLMADVVVLGLVHGTLLSLSQLRNMLINGLHGIDHLPLLGLFGLTVLGLLLFRKNLYCTYLCPFGAAQELIGQNTGPRRPVPPKVIYLLSACRSVLLLAVGFALLAGIDFDPASVEPFAVFSVRAASAWILFLAGACLLVSAFYPRAWCRFLCPTGYLLSLFRWGLLDAKGRKAVSSIPQNTQAA